MKRQNETIRFTVSLPAALLDDLDTKVADRGYTSRSEFVRDMIRDQIVETKWRNAKEDVVGVLTVGYDHHQRELTQKIVDIQHNRYVNIMCTTHVHLDHDNCLEAIIVRGLPAEIERIRTQIGALKGVRFAKLSKASKVEF
jgi:CopG family nickel-responsive transcriptional regulator